MRSRRWLCVGKTAGFLSSGCRRVCPSSSSLDVLIPYRVCRANRFQQTHLFRCCQDRAAGSTVADFLALRCRLVGFRRRSIVERPRLAFLPPAEVRRRLRPVSRFVVESAGRVGCLVLNSAGHSRQHCPNSVDRTVGLIRWLRLRPMAPKFDLVEHSSCLGKPGSEMQPRPMECRLTEAESVRFRRSMRQARQLQVRCFLNWRCLALQRFDWLAVPPERLRLKPVPTVVVRPEAVSSLR